MTELVLHTPGEPPLLMRFDPPAGDPHLSALRPWLAAIFEAVTEGRQITPSFNDGLACAEIMDDLRTAMERAA